MNQYDLAKAMLDAKAEVDAAIAAYVEAIRADADAEDRERRAKAKAYVEVREELGGKPTVAHIEALVDERTAELQKRARLAEGFRRAASMRVDAGRSWLSALQSIAAMARAEAELAKWTPRELESA